MKLVILLSLSSAIVAQVLHRHGSIRRQGGLTSTNIDSQLRTLLLSNYRNNLVVSSNRDSSSGSSDSCRTPDGQIGLCRPLSQCNSFMQYVSVLHYRNVLNFFRERICRLLEREIHLCCPLPPSAQRQNDEVQSQVPQGTFLPTEQECGIPSSDRIVGGEEAAVGSWPWLSVIGWPLRDGRFIGTCAGTLITRRHVLSAAHCLLPGRPQATFVRLGEHSLSRNDGAPQDIRISSPPILFGYNTDTKENDIMLIRLQQDANFNDFVRPACLPINPPMRDSGFEGAEMTVVGWGVLFFGSNVTSDVPLEVDVPVRNLEDCSRIYREATRDVVNSNNLCAGEEGKDSCRGDSGGPLNYLNEETGRFYVVGIVSHGIECARQKYPAVYTRVGAFMGWILNNLK